MKCLKEHEIIGIIPARGGSKGLPHKNIKTIAGKQLIGYTIESALKSAMLSRVIVSTDDGRIAEISRKYGVEVIDRPTELAKDETPTVDVILHVFKILKSENVVIVLLQPTSPLRNVQDIDESIKLFLKNDCESVVSVCEASHSPYWGFNIDNKYLKSIFGVKYLKTRRQELPKAYIPNGAMYISTLKALEEHKSFYCDKTLPYLMPLERSMDIDNELDFILVELLIEKKGVVK